MFKEWRKNFLTGFLTVLPLVITLFLIIWFFKKLDSLIIGQIVNFLPQTWTNITVVRIFWKLVALVIVIGVVSFIGLITRNVLGKKMLELTEVLVTRVPIVNKIYTSIKEIRDIFVGGKKEFNRVVLVEYLNKGHYVIGFVVNPAPGEICEKMSQPLLSVFLPTSLNPTSGWLIFVSDRETVPLKMCVEEAMKLIISGGTIKL